MAGETLLPPGLALTLSRYSAGGPAHRPPPPRLPQHWRHCSCCSPPSSLPPYTRAQPFLGLLVTLQDTQLCLKPDIIDITSPNGLDSRVGKKAHRDGDGEQGLRGGTSQRVDRTVPGPRDQWPGQKRSSLAPKRLGSCPPVAAADGAMHASLQLPPLQDTEGLMQLNDLSLSRLLACSCGYQGRSRRVVLLCPPPWRCGSGVSMGGGRCGGGDCQPRPGA